MKKNCLTDQEKFLVRDKIRDMGADAVAMHSGGELADLLSRTMQIDLTAINVASIVKSLNFQLKRAATLAENAKSQADLNDGDTDRRLTAIEARIDKIGASLESILEELTKPSRTAHEGNGQGRNHLLV